MNGKAIIVIAIIVIAAAALAASLFTVDETEQAIVCLLYTSPSPRDRS